MGFGPGGGASAVGSRTDVALNNTQTGHVLGYDDTTAKWRNISAGAAPSGGTTSQLLTKQSSVDQDLLWQTPGQLTTSPPLADDVTDAGTSLAAARADHVHPISEAVGYPLDTARYSMPMGASNSTTTTSISSGYIRVSPLPVYRPFQLSVVAPYPDSNTGTKNVQIAIFQGNDTNWQPADRVGGVISATLSGNTFTTEPSFASPIQLTPGMYWVAVLSLGSSSSYRVLLEGVRSKTYHVSHDFDASQATYLYRDGAFNTMPSTLSGENLFLDNQFALYYHLKPFAV